MNNDPYAIMKGDEKLNAWKRIFDRLARSFIESRGDEVNYHEIDIALSGLRFQVANLTWSAHRQLQVQ